MNLSYSLKNKKTNVKIFTENLQASERELKQKLNNENSVRYLVIV